MKVLNLLAGPVLAAGVVAMLAAPAQAAAPACHAHVCLWTGPNYTGAVFTWWEANGNRFIGHTHADKVGSFVATSGACFVDTADSEWNWHAKRLASRGDYSPNYRARFGNVMDRIAPARYC